MDNEKNPQIETAEELEAEKQHLAEVKEDEVRASIISEFGFNEEDDKERIDKAVARELGYKKSLSSAIGQKIKYREKLKTTPPKTDTQAKNFSEEDLDRKVTERLEKRDLESMEYPDDIKETIAQVAKINNFSVRKAVSDPYVKAKIDAWQKQKDAEEAALNRTNKTGKKGGEDTLTPPDVDLRTPEGRAEYDAWKARMIKAGH